MYKDELRKSRQQVEQMKRLLGVFGEFKIQEQIGTYGNIVSKEQTKEIIDEAGNKDTIKMKNIVYNILLKNGSLASEKWFDTYDYDRRGNCIIGFKRSFDESEKLKDIPNYITSEGELLERYSYIYGAINTEGVLAVSPIYDWLSWGNEDSYTAYHNGNLGYVSSIDGKHITPIIFPHAQPFSEGLAAVEFNGNTGYVDRNRVLENPEYEWEYAIAPQYEWGGDFEDGIAEVGKDSETIKIDKKNNIVNPKVKQLK